MNIFNIGKANARITELETELAAYKENETAVEKQAEKLQGELKAAQDSAAGFDTKISKLESDLKASISALEKSNADLKASQAQQADFDAKVEKAATTKASAQAGAIVGAVGVPPVAATQIENPAAAVAEKPKLFGLARYQAAIKEQVAAQLNKK